MKTLLEKESKTPLVMQDESSGKLYITGLIIPENPEVFFTKLNQIINSTYKIQKEICIEFNLEYFNTGAARFLYKMFLELKQMSNAKVIWKYEEDDEDIFESGKEFEELTDIDFSFEKL